MELADYLSPSRVVIVQTPSKRAALEELIQLIAPELPEVPVERLRDAIWHREGLMSTGIGNGLAIPHVRLSGVSRAYTAVAVSPEGILDYDSLDSIPVRIVIMTVAPEGEHETYVRLLATAVDVLKRPELRGRIQSSRQVEEIYACLTGKDA